MKMKKRILSVALALALGLSAAGCSKNDDAFELQIFAGGYGTEMWEYVLELFEEDHPDVKIVTYMDSNANNSSPSAGDRAIRPISFSWRAKGWTATAGWRTTCFTTAPNG